MARQYALEHRKFLEANPAVLEGLRSGKSVSRLGVLLSLAISLGAQSTAADARLETVHYPAEFRFLTHVPPNAIRTPVMFVWGHGILDEFCGLTIDCPYDY